LFHVVIAPDLILAPHPGNAPEDMPDDPERLNAARLDRATTASVVFDIKNATAGGFCTETERPALCRQALALTPFENPR
jgi:hypothetical protein